MTAKTRGSNDGNLAIKAGTMPAWSPPIRIPKDIEITHTDPPLALVDESATWRLSFKLAKVVPAGAELRLQLWGGRNNKGTFFDLQTEDPEAAGYASAELADGTPLPMHPIEPAGTYRLEVPVGGLPKGTALTVQLGTGKPGQGVRVCGGHVLDKYFLLYVPPAEQAGSGTPAWSGGSVWAPQTWDRIVAACTMHILGEAIHHLRAYAPATVRPGWDAEFPILVRPEDELGNLSSGRLGAVAVLLDGQPVPVRISTVPDSACIVAWTSLSAAGVYRFLVRDTVSGKETRTNPVVCSATAQPVYWGMIHGHTEMSDGTGTLDRYFHQLRHDVLLDFGGTGDHDHLWETPDDFWQTTCAQVREHNAPGAFVALLGYEWAKWRQNGDGDRNVYYLGDDRPMYRSDDGEYPTPPDLFRALAENKEKAIVIPHHTGHGGNWCDWKDHGPAFERLVEIFQCRGSYECSAADGNPVPEPPGPHPARPEGYVRRALALGWRVGFTAGGDDHGGHWGTEVRFPYKQGLMSVEAPEKTRAAIFDALYHRRVVATTGARMLLTYRLNSQPMGSELSVKNMPELASRRSLTIEFHGTAGVDRIDIIRNNAGVQTVPGQGREDLTVAWEDTEPMDALWPAPAKFCDHPFAFYYVRVVQQDNEVAWASPIWIDP
ncbi:DUF3604 domain-containing protein [bacterium]|nr:DUF3604 domain-containing protein [bacterium]